MLAWAWGLVAVERMKQASFYAFALYLSAEVENVVDTILFLLSNRSSMTTGSTLPVDGGFLAT